MLKGKKPVKGRAGAPTGRVKLTAAEPLKRLQDFAERKEPFVATVRKGKDRGVSA